MYDIYKEKFNLLKREVKNYPRLNPKEIRFLWFIDFWDRPLDGICIYQSKKYYYLMFNYDDYIAFQDGLFEDYDNSKYVLFELTDEQLLEEVKAHELFKEKVGLHTDYDQYGKRKIGALRSKDLQEEYFQSDKKRTHPDYSESPIIGWFEIEQMSDLGWKKKE